MLFAWLFAGLPAAADLPSYSGWPRCSPVLGFSDGEIGVAAFETFYSPQPSKRWICLSVDRSTFLVTPVDESTFDERFPGVRNDGNHGPADCQEMVKNMPPTADGSPPPSCIDTRLLCGGREVNVQLSSAVAKVPCPGRLFASATMIEGDLWAGVNPLDIYLRELAGSGLMVQSLKSGAVRARRTSAQLGGRNVCAIRRDPVSGSVWATTETGLVELGTDGKIKRTLRFRGGKRLMQDRPGQ